MMRVWKFAKTDVIRTKRYAWIYLLPLLALVILVSNPEGAMGALFGISYCLFMCIVLATFPFDVERGEEAGFLSALPAQPGEDILGHYLYAFLILALGFLEGVICVGIVRWFYPAIGDAADGMNMRSAYLLLYGIALLFIGAEDLILTIFRYEGGRAMQLIRIIPGFLFFFGFSFLSDHLMTAEKDSIVQSALIALFQRGGGEVFLICLALFILLAHISSRISARR